MRFPMLIMRFIPRKKKSMKDTMLDMRPMFNGIKSIPVTDTETKVENIMVKYDETEIKVRIYTPKSFDGASKLPVLYYIHGGGFFAGSSEVVQEACKYFCEKFPCITVAIDYRLAPENPYPAAHNDCYAILEWIYKNIGKYGGNPDEIFVAGDSAGGNLTAYCCLKDRESGKKMVKAEVLYYPSVNMCGREDEYFKPGSHNYEILPKYEKIVFGMLDMMAGDGSLNVLGEILGVKDITVPYLSPYQGELSGMPPTILLVGEYDFLVPECKAFAKKLTLAGVSTETIIYKGIMHAFLDSMGVLPQAEDSVLEVIEFVKRTLKA
jgi:acetyl esterase